VIPLPPALEALAKRLNETQTNAIGAIEVAWREVVEPLVADMRWIAGQDDSKPYTTYYERWEDKNPDNVVPPYYEIAEAALARLERAEGEG
jgi:hypothetical protein